MKIDEIFEHIGENFGRYHQILYLVIFLGGIPNALMLLHFVYSHYDVDFYCKLPETAFNISTSDNKSLSYEELVNLSIPMEKNPEEIWVRSQCKMYDFDYSSSNWIYETTNQTTNCKYGYVFDLDEGVNTAVAEFEMVCDRSWMVPIAVSSVQIGMAVGSFSGGLADRFGRRPIFIGASVAQVLCSIIIALSWDYYSYAIGNFLAGCSQLVNYVVAFVLASEVIAVSRRNFIAISSFFSFGLGFCLEAALGYFFQDWRHLLWSIVVLSAIFYIPTILLLPESARWLIIKGRTEKGKKELKRMAKMNKCEFDVEDFMKAKMLDDNDQKTEKKSTAIQTFKILLLTKLRSRCLTVFYIWFVTGLAYYAISLYSTNFSENRFINLFLAGASEFPALLVAYYAVKLSGRPRAAFGLMFACGSSSLMLPFMTNEDIWILRTIVAMIGKGAISAIFYVAYFLSAETAPTLQRSSSISIASFCARVGGFGAPFLAYLGKKSPLIPNLMMGVLVLCAGFLCIFFVPETRGVPLPDSKKEALSNKRIYGLNICRDLSPDSKSESNKGTVEI